MFYFEGVKYYSNGKKSFEGILNEGIPNGKGTKRTWSYFEYEKIVLVFDLFDSLGREFYETGKISFEGIFKEGRRNGKGNKND